MARSQDTRRSTVRLAVVAAALLSWGCPARTPGPVAGPRRKGPEVQLGRLEVFSRSDTRPVTSATVLGDEIFAGTPGGLLRFERKTGKHQLIRRMEGIPDAYLYGNRGQPIGRVHGVSGSGTAGLWLATDKLLVQYQDGKWARHEYHPMLGLPVTALLAEGDNVWVGGERNLAIFNGWWHGFLRGSRVTYLLADRMFGGVWVGTSEDGIFHYDKGKFLRQGEPEGQRITRVRCITYNQSWGVLAVGRGAAGEQLAFYDGKHWTSYTPDTAEELNWVQQFGEETLLSVGRRVLRLLRAPLVEATAGSESEPPPQGPVRFEGRLAPDAPAGYPRHHFYTKPADLWLPPDPTQVVGYGNEALFSTRDRGVALYDGKTTDWFRVNDLVGDNGRLRMACVPRHGCFLPGGRGGAYRVKGTDFHPVAVTDRPGHRVSGFFTDINDDLYALHTPPAARSLVISRLEGGTFKALSETFVSMPAGKLSVRFIRDDPDFRLWIGLLVVDDTGAVQDWGVVVLPGPAPRPERVRALDPELPDWVEPELELPEWAGEGEAAMPGADPAPTGEPEAGAARAPGASPDPGAAATAAALPSGGREPPLAPAVRGTLLFHRSTLLPGEERPDGSLALPDDIRDVRFSGRETWVATGYGVIRVRGQDLLTFTENEGLASEIAYTVLPRPGGALAATLSGLGRYDGKEWRFDLATQLNLGSRALVDADARGLLVGTARGVLQQADRHRYRFIDERLGLVSDDVTDLQLDLEERLWVLTSAGLSIVTFK